MREEQTLVIVLLSRPFRTMGLGFVSHEFEHLSVCPLSLLELVPFRLLVTFPSVRLSFNAEKTKIEKIKLEKTKRDAKRKMIRARIELATCH